MVAIYKESYKDTIDAVSAVNHSQFSKNKPKTYQ